MLTSSRLCAKEVFFDKSASVKYIIYKKLRNSNESTFSFIPHACYFFIWPLDCFFRRSEFINYLHYQIHGERNTVTRTLISLPQTLNWSKHFIGWGCFEICCGNNNTLLLLYACDVIHLINKGLTLPYVQEQGGILLKFNILRFHYATYCA